MKIWIVGPQGCGQESIGVPHGATSRIRIARFFTDQADHPGPSGRYYHYTPVVVSEIFENNAYVFLMPVQGSRELYEGLEFNEYDVSNVIVLGLDQFVWTDKSYIGSEDVVIFLDGSRSWRYKNLKACGAVDVVKRDLYERSWYERAWDDVLDQTRVHGNTLYLFEEDPDQVNKIIKNIINKPTTVEKYKKIYILEDE